MKNMQIAWIGLGSMGLPMCLKIIENEKDVTVFNRTKEKTREAVAAGARLADSPEEAVKDAEVIFTMVTDSEALEQVIMGQDGLINSLKENSILIDMSTISPDYSAKLNKVLQAKNANYLRAPVIGSTSLAKSGNLRVICSGDKGVFEKVQYLLKYLSRSQVYLGPREESRYMKLCNNLMVGVIAQMLAETFVFGQKAGLNLQLILNVIEDSPLSSPYILYKSKAMIERDFSPAATVKILEKDFDLILNVAKEIGTDVPITDLTKRCLTKAKETGKGHLDFSALLLLNEEMSGIKGNM